MSKLIINTSQYDQRTTDPSPLTDGMFWYRSDLNQFKSRINGVTETVAIGTVNSRTNYVLVKSKSDLPTPVGGIITLANNCAYELNGTINLGTDRIVVGTSNIIYGIDKSDDILIYTGSGDAITGTNQDLSLRSFTIVANTSGAKCFNLSGDATNRLEIAEIIFANSDEIGTITGGFATIVFRNNLLTGNSDGLTISGNNNDLFITDNVIENFLTTPTFFTVGTGNYHTIIIDRNMFETATGQTALNISNTIVFTGGGTLQSNVFEGAGTYLTGINANTSGWRIPPRSNVGVAGLLVIQQTVVISSWITTATSYVDIPETSSLGNASDYEPNASVIEARMVASVSHDQSGRDTGIQLYDKTNEALVAGTEIIETIVTAGIFQVVSNPSFTVITGGREYRVALRRVTGTGSNDAILRSAVLELKIY